MQPSKASIDFLNDAAAAFGPNPFLLTCSCPGRCSFPKVARETPCDEIRTKFEEHFYVPGSSTAPPLTFLSIDKPPCVVALYLGDA